MSQDTRIRNPPSNVNLIDDITTFEEIRNDNDDKDTVQNLYWSPNQEILNSVMEWVNNLKAKNVMEIGPGSVPFPCANWFIDAKVGENTILIDIDKEKIPFDDKHFDFIYARHVLEDLQNPDFALNDFIRSSQNGYMETPSPLVELMSGVDGNQTLSAFYKGYIHHRYFVWSDIKTNTIYFLPKMPIIEKMQIPDAIRPKIAYLLNHYPVYWNNYFIFKDGVKPNIVMYKHSINYDIFKDTMNLILNGIITSIANTNYFVKTFCHKKT